MTRILLLLISVSTIAAMQSGSPRSYEDGYISLLPKSVTRKSVSSDGSHTDVRSSTLDDMENGSGCDYVDMGELHPVEPASRDKVLSQFPEVDLGEPLPPEPINKPTCLHYLCWCFCFPRPH